VEEPLGHFKKQNTHTCPHSIFQNVWQSFIFLKWLVFTPFLTALSMGITELGPFRFNLAQALIPVNCL
jgi:uncharacterized membrane protein